MGSSKEHRKRHASEFQSKRNDRDLVMCNVNKLHSQGDRVPKRHHGEPVRPRRRRRTEFHFRRGYISRPFTSRLLKKVFSTACALTLVSPEAGEKVRKEASFYAGC